MSPLDQFVDGQTRRAFFKSTGLAVGRIALAGLMAPELARKAMAAGTSSTCAHPALPGLPHFAPKAKRLIYLFMNGIPIQPKKTVNPLLFYHPIFKNKYHYVFRLLFFFLFVMNE